MSVAACARSSRPPPPAAGSASRPPSPSNSSAPTAVATAICPALNATRTHGLRSTNRSATSVDSAEIQMPAPVPHSTALESPAVAERLHVAVPESVLLHIVSETRQITTQAT